MFGYGSKYSNVYFKIRAYCLQICTANDEHKMFKTIAHFTVVCLVTWPWIGSEAGVNFVLIQTSLLFICKCKLVSIRTA